jgi:hypothetical protein
MKNLFQRYIWLVDIIHRTGKISFEEINKRWLRNEMSEGKEIPLRTFHNHRIAIEEMFDVNIECDKRNGYVYYIEESHKLKRRILFEEIPSGQRFLTLIIEAMHYGSTLEITYQSFRRQEPSAFEIEPYCLKIFKQRWYVLAQSSYYDALRIKLYNVKK